MRTGLIFASLITLCSLSMTACGQSDEGETALQLPPQPVVKVTESTMAIETADFETQQQAFNQFWQAFRSAIAADNKTAIADLAEFPFELRGEMDFMPVLSLSREELIARVGEILAYQENVAESPDSRMLTAAEIVSEVNQVTLRNREHYRIANLEFMVVAGQWRFVRAYIDETE